MFTCLIRTLNHSAVVYISSSSSSKRLTLGTCMILASASLCSRTLRPGVTSSVKLCNVGVATLILEGQDSASKNLLNEYKHPAKAQCDSRLVAIQQDCAVLSWFSTHRENVRTYGANTTCSYVEVVRGWWFSCNNLNAITHANNPCWTYIYIYIYIYIYNP